MVSVRMLLSIKSFNKQHPINGGFCYGDLECMAVLSNSVTMKLCMYDCLLAIITYMYSVRVCMHAYVVHVSGCGVLQLRLSCCLSLLMLAIEYLSRPI